jgi:hypothetical protein
MKSHRLNICIRTSERTGGVDNFKEASESLQKEMNGESNKIILLLDLGYAKPDNHNTLATNAKTVIKSLTKKVDDWLEVVVSSSSFPEDLSKFKPAHSVVHRITRYEWVIWNTIIKDDNCKNIKYSDFGTKYPFYIEANFAGSVSVKYSVKDEFVIHKGELTNEHKEGHGQYIMHAFKLITSKDYSGRGFSWGDGKIYEIAHEDLKNEKKKTGSSTTRVQISQNHHITLIDSLL